MKPLNKNSASSCFVLVAIGMASTTCLAETIPVSEPIPTTGFVEAGIGHADLTGNNANWNDQYLRGNVRLNPSTRLFGEVSHQDHFDENGTFVGMGVTHDFNDIWYGSLSVGGSDKGSFLPKERVDGSLSHKWLDKKNLVTSAGFTYYHSREGYIDRALLLEVAYYFDAPWIIQVGARLNRSNPGDVQSNRGYAAITYGRDKQYYLTLRHDEGKEAYQVVGSNALLSDFSSRETSLIWRQWLSSRYGFNLRANEYKNPSYRRTELQAGVFVEF